MNNLTIISVFVLLLAMAVPPYTARSHQEPITDDFVDAPYTTIPADETPSESVTAVVSRYSEIHLTDAELDTLARVIWLEARGEPFDGQQAVAEVILNRVISPDFPDTVHDVLHQGEDTAVPQFSAIGNLSMAEPVATQYEAIDAALYGPSILPEDVVFFSRNGENDRVWGQIQNHVFCYEYVRE